MIRVRQVKLGFLNNSMKEIKIKTARLLKIDPCQINDIIIVKESIDARKKDNIFYVYEVDAKVTDEERVLKKTKSGDIFKTPEEKYQFPILGNKKLLHRPIIVGSGPAGLFCAYQLAKYGYKPLIIERGEKMENRIETVETFFKSGHLNPNSNVQFGEGGAGTFSDGKLNTLVKDKFFRGKEVFEIFVSCGADKEIMYLNQPHIGTDVLRKVIINLRNKIIEMGGEIRYQTCLTEIKIDDNKINKLIINNNEEIPCDILVLAIGHSARDTITMLYNNHLEMSAKPFAIGVRVEHLQEMVNKNQYGSYYHNFKPASYKLTYTTKKGRGVYSFCMCPGGYVINSSSEEGMLAINGMSNHQRDTKNANSAIVVTINPEDFGKKALDGIAFQRELEKKAFEEGKGKIPLQLFKDFKDNKKSTSIGNIEPITKGAYELSNLNNILPEFVGEAIKEAMLNFETKINGFASDDTLLFGVESRTSSPVRMERNETGVSNILGIYPCGEGSGYAGGITTAAMDGIKIAEEIAKIYKP